jgi:hypothetical protein
MSKLTKKLGLKDNATEVDIINAITAIEKNFTDEINRLKSVVPADIEATVKGLNDEHAKALKAKDVEIEALKKQIVEPVAEGTNSEAKKAAAKTRELHPELKDTALFVTEDLLTFINIGDAIAHMKSEKHQTQPVEC